jgi:F-type H+-transporting ATPase subunit a
VLAADFPTMRELVIWPSWFLKNTNFAFNKVSFLSLLAMLIPVLLFLVAGAKYKKRLVPSGVQNIAEGAVDLVEKQIIMPTIGSEGLGYLPLLLTMFLFIFIGNLFEIIPTAQFPANARMANPLVLALMSWLVFIFVGLKHHGPKYFWDAINPPGVPVALKLLVVPIELISVFIVRPFSLAIRLFANMLAGHILILTFIGLIFILQSLVVAVFVIPVGIIFYLFELVIVIGIQAFIFAALSAIYIGSAIEPEH